MHSFATGTLVSTRTSLVSSSHPSLRTVAFAGRRSLHIAPSPGRALPEDRVEDSSALLPRDISSRFGLRLRELRRAQNMTQLRMAVDFGIDRSFISDVERGRKSISLHMLEVIALGLKVSLSDLFRGL